MRKTSFAELAFSAVTALAAVTIVFLISGIFLTLLTQSMPAIKQFGIIDFILSTDWNPVTESFGAASSIYGTIVTTFLALLIAIPISLGIAIFLTEIAPGFLKGPVGMAIELLAAIPSIIYGMWGLFTFAPIMANHVEPVLIRIFGDIPVISVLFQGTPLGIDLLTSSIILSIMIIPFTACISRDAFNLTPAILKESAYAIGTTKWEVVKNIVLPYSKLGVFGGAALSLGRALGETMAVAFVLGNKHHITASLLDAAATITVTLANEFTEASSDLYLSSLYYLALILFVMSFVILAIAKLFLLKVERGVSR